MSLQIRIFMGFIQNKEIKIHLNQSLSWKEAKLVKDTSLVENQWQEKEYIGLFIPLGMAYTLLKEKEKEIRGQVQIYCPKLHLDKHPVYLFSQVFLL